VTDIPIADYVELAGQCVLFALVVGCVVAAVRAVKSALDAETSAANQAAWTQHLPTCGLCGAHRLLTETTITVLDDIGHKIRDSYSVAICHDCKSAITLHEQEKAA